MPCSSIPQLCNVGKWYKKCLIQELHDNKIQGNKPFSNCHSRRALIGLEMFDLLSPEIVRVVEDLDRNHGCLEYWSLKTKVQTISESELNRPQPKSTKKESCWVW